MPAPARNRVTRIADSKRRLERDIDLWVASADPAGGPPALVPLSFDWDGTDLMLVTETASPAGRNMRNSGLARVALGDLRDVIMIDASARELAFEEVPEARWVRFADRTGWDPRTGGTGYAAYLLVPQRIQAWRESVELTGRTIMRGGSWCA